MGIQLMIKEISLADMKLGLSLEVRCDHYRPGIRAPRIEAVFDNESDNRRMVIHASSFGPGGEPGSAICYAAAEIWMKYVFWDCIFEDCRLHFDLEYDGQTFLHVPIIYDGPGLKKAGSGKKDSIEFSGGQIHIHFAEKVQTPGHKDLSPLAAVLAVLLHGCGALIGILLLPWFAVDVLGMLLLGTEEVEGDISGSFLKRFVFYVSWRYFNFGRNKNGVAGMKINILKLSYQLFSAFSFRKKGILFLSTRRNDLTGNFEYVYEYLKDPDFNPDRKIRFWLHPEDLRNISIFKLLELSFKAGRSRVILLDDYVLFLEYMGISRKTEVVQLWHACGAFKTFGFSRTGKRGGPRQIAPTHRDYTYAFVSSSAIAKFYAEGFGIAERKIIPYGVPRTDMFFDEKVREEKRKMLYEEHPGLKDKKIILFAPTFRGDGKMSAHYEKDRFDPNRLMDKLSGDYVLIVKHHPFVKMKYKVTEDNKDRIYDFSRESEINDLLFITDLLITDYSSVVYEASLLSIPMLFYAYDLENYVATRDFYSGYEHFVPGRIVRSQEELLGAIISGNYEAEKIDAFCQANFDIRDGKASERVAGFIRDLL